MKREVGECLDSVLVCLYLTSVPWEGGFSQGEGEK